METLINITDVEELRTALNNDPVDGDDGLNQKIAWLLGQKTHPDYVTVTYVRDDKTYKIYYTISCDSFQNVTCQFSHMQQVMESA